MTSIAYGALWIFVFSVPWERVIVLPGISIISRVAGGLALGLALLAVVISGRVRRWHAFHVLALLFVLWDGFCLMVLHIQGIPQKYWTYVQLVLVIWMMWELAPTRARQLGLLAAYVCGAYVAAFDTLILYRTQGSAIRRFAAGGADPNDCAMVLALGLPMAWYLGMTYRKPLLQWACRAYLPIALVVVGLTGSRGGMLASFVALLFVPLSMMRLSPGKLMMTIAMLALSGTLAVVYVPERLVERFASTTTDVEDLRFGGRFKLWVAGVHAFTHKPIMGYGTSGFINAITPELGSASQVAHNAFLSVLVEQGIVGLLIYLMMFGAVFFSLLDLPRLERRLALVLFTTCVVAMLPLTWEDRKAAWFVLAALVGLSQATDRVVLRPAAAPAVRRGPLPVPLARARPLSPRAAPLRETRRHDP